MRVYLILLASVTLVQNTAAVSSAKADASQLKWLQENMFDDLIQYILSPAVGDHTSVKESRKESSEDMSPLIEKASDFKKSNFHGLNDNENSNDISPASTNDLEKNSEGMNNAEARFPKPDSKNVFGSQNKAKNEEEKELDPNQSPMLYKDMRESSFLNLLMPFFAEKLRKGEQRNIAMPDNWHSSAQIDTKMLKSPVEVDGRTGTKFYDSRPNVTDLLIDIRNVTKDKLGRNQSITIDTFSTKSPLHGNPNKQNELQNSPTMIDVGKKFNNRENNLFLRPVDKKITQKRKANDALINSLTVTPKREDEKNERSKKKKVNYRSVKSQNKEKLTETKTNSSMNSAEREKLSTFFDHTNLSEHHFNHLEHAKRFNEPARHKLKNFLDTNEVNGKASLIELSNLKNLSLREREIAILTDRIITDVVEAVNKKLHYNQNYILDPKKDFERKSELQQAISNVSNTSNTSNVGNSSNASNVSNKTFQQQDMTLHSKLQIDPISVDTTLAALKKENYRTLDSLKLPIATTKLTIKDSGIPLYNIPHSNIYLYELDPIKRMTGNKGELEQNNQLDLLTAFSQILNNNNSIFNFRKADQSDLDIVNRNLFSYRNIFQKNSLPEILNQIPILSELDASHRKGTVLNSAHKNTRISLSDNQESQESTVPEIEIRIKNMPLIRESGKDGTQLLNEKQGLNKQETFLSLVRNGKRNRTNYNSPYNRMLSYDEMFGAHTVQNEAACKPV